MTGIFFPYKPTLTEIADINAEQNFTVIVLYTVSG